MLRRRCSLRNSSRGWGLLQPRKSTLAVTNYGALFAVQKSPLSTLNHERLRDNSKCGWKPVLLLTGLWMAQSTNEEENTKEDPFIFHKFTQKEEEELKRVEKRKALFASGIPISKLKANDHLEATLSKWDEYIYYPPFESIDDTHPLVRLKLPPSFEQKAEQVWWSNEYNASLHIQQANNVIQSARDFEQLFAKMQHDASVLVEFGTIEFERFVVPRIVYAPNKQGYVIELRRATMDPEGNRIILKMFMTQSAIVYKGRAYIITLATSYQLDENNKEEQHMRVTQRVLNPIVAEGLRIQDRRE